MSIPAGQPDSDLVPFAFGDVTVRAGVDGDRPWFVLGDLATALGYRDAANAGRNLRPDQLGTHLVSTSHTPQRMLTVTESGMYRLVLRSTRPEAERFQDWVTDEVLPAIRRTGLYVDASRTTEAERALIDARHDVLAALKEGHYWWQVAMGRRPEEHAESPSVAMRKACRAFDRGYVRVVRPALRVDAEQARPLPS